MSRAPSLHLRTCARAALLSCFTVALSTPLACTVSRETAEITERELDGSPATMMSADGLLEARFAAGALPGPTTVRIVLERSSENLERLTPVYRLEPQGLVLAASIELRVRPARASTAELVLAEVTDEGTAVDESSSLDPDDGRVRARVSRFGRFVVLRRGAGCTANMCGAPCGARGARLCTASGLCVAPALHPGCGGADGGISGLGDGGPFPTPSGDGGPFPTPSGDGGPFPTPSGDGGPFPTPSGDGGVDDGSVAACELSAPPRILVDELEQGNALAVPQFVTLADCAVSRVRAAFDTPGDVDLYAFDVPPGVLAFVRVRLHSELFDVERCDGLASALDVQDILASGPASPPSTCPSVDVVVGEGRYRVRVADEAGSARAYALSILATFYASGGGGDGGASTPDGDGGASTPVGDGGASTPSGDGGVSASDAGR